MGIMNKLWILGITGGMINFKRQIHIPTVGGDFCFPTYIQYNKARYCNAYHIVLLLMHTICTVTLTLFKH